MSVTQFTTTNSHEMTVRKYFYVSQHIEGQLYIQERTAGTRYVLWVLSLITESAARSESIIFYIFTASKPTVKIPSNTLNRTLTLTK